MIELKLIYSFVQLKSVKTLSITILKLNQQSLRMKYSVNNKYLVLKLYTAYSNGSDEVHVDVVDVQLSLLAQHQPPPPQIVRVRRPLPLLVGQQLEEPDRHYQVAVRPVKIFRWFFFFFLR